MWVSQCGYNWCHDASFKADRPLGASGNIIMIIRSPARITINGKVHYTKGNCVVTLRQQSHHIYAAHNAPFVNDWVRFCCTDEDNAFLASIGIKLDTIQEFPDVRELSHYVQLMAVESHAGNINAVDSMALLMRLLLLKISDYSHKNPASYTQFTKKLMALRNDIYSFPQRDWSIDTICKSMSVSPSHLQHKYKQLYGNSIKSDIIASRLEYSKYLLANTDHSISTISNMIGYENDVHFMYIFKKKTGLTPSGYRNASVEYAKQNEV